MSDQTRGLAQSVQPGKGARLGQRNLIHLPDHHRAKRRVGLPHRGLHALGQMLDRDESAITHDRRSSCRVAEFADGVVWRGSRVPGARRAPWVTARAVRDAHNAALGQQVRVFWLAVLARVNNNRLLPVPRFLRDGSLGGELTFLLLSAKDAGPDECGERRTERAQTSDRLAKIEQPD